MIVDKEYEIFCDVLDLFGKNQVTQVIRKYGALDPKKLTYLQTIISGKKCMKLKVKA